MEPECVLVWEKKPTLEEERKAKSLQLPLTFFCGTSSDADTEPDRPEDFGTELQKVQQAQVSVIRVLNTTVKQNWCILIKFFFFKSCVLPPSTFFHILSSMIQNLCLI